MQIRPRRKESFNLCIGIFEMERGTRGCTDRTACLRDKKRACCDVPLPPRGQCKGRIEPPTGNEGHAVCERMDPRRRQLRPRNPPDRLLQNTVRSDDTGTVQNPSLVGCDSHSVKKRSLARASFENLIL